MPENMTHQFPTDKLTAIVNDAIEQALRAGADAAEADVSDETGISVTARCQEVEKP